MFLQAYNQMMGDRERVMEDCSAIRAALCDCEKLEVDIAKRHDEIDVVAGLVKSAYRITPPPPCPKVSTASSMRVL